MTSEGPRQVKDLVGKKFTAIVDGVPFESYKEGFFSSGVKDVYRVKTKRGYSVRITHDHELFKIEEGVSKKTPLNELEVGDMIALSNQRENASWSGEGTFDEGWLLGVLVGDGTFHRNSATDSACLDFWGDHKDDMVEKVNKIFEAHPELSPRNGNYNEDQDRVRIASKGLERLAAKFGIVRGNKTVTREVEQASSDFYKGFLQGFFDTDGSPQGTVSSGASVRLSQSDLPCLEGVQRMLARFGIMSKVYANRRDAQIKPMPDGKGGLKEYSCRAQHELVIPRDNMFLFKEMVDFSNVDKKVRLDNILSQYGERGPYPENFRDEIVLIEQEGSEEVFDCTIHNAHQLDASGLRIANCGETPGNPYVTTVCLLGSINLTQYVNQDRSFDFDTYKEDIQVFARMLENVNDIGNCPLPHYQWALENVRQYGMGLNGLGSALFMMGERYGSDNSLELVAEFGRIREDITWRQSALLAKERGPAPAFRESFFETPYFKELCQASEDTKELMRKYGLRNLKTSLNPPLGNTSGLCDAISNGIEPAFYFNYDRTFILDVWPEGLNADNVRDILREKEVAGNVVWEGEYNGKFYYYEPSNRGLCGVERQRDYGYAWVEEHYPEDIENGADYLVTAQDLSVMDHLNVQIEVQKYVNQSVSKTVNLPADYPYEDFKELYLKAWQGGLVGFTTYRAGTMESVLSTDKASEGTYKDLDFLNALKDNECISEVAEITDEGVIVNGVRVPESFDNGPTHVIKREGNKYYLHFSHLANCREHPLALWIYSNNMQEGEYVSLNRGVRKLQKLLVDKGVEVDLVLDQVEKLKGCPHCERLGKMISMCLRHNIKIPTIIQTLEGIEEDYISSTLTAVRKFLATAVKDGTKKEGVTCPDCGSSEVVFESGCGRCLTCGSSGCG
jgi:ribonucleoside-diphosphate reductase alpha chain